ncbi:MAG: extracellular solute-binding protein [Spirochaetaceae bacterium]|nr:MAG: extracellular solute-binding protein [Spirochaetaceae bacterium]
MKVIKCFLISGLLVFTAAALFAGGGQETGPATLTFMVHAADLPKEWVDQFNGANPDINLVRVEVNWEKWVVEAMTGTAPDLRQLELGSDTPYYARRGLFLDITDYLKKSELIKMDDIDAPASVHYRWDGTDSGKGPWYGLCKDYSAIGSITYNVEMFKKAGLAKLSTTQPIAYQNELYELAKKLTVKDSSGNVIFWGYEISPDWVQLFASDMAYAEGTSFFTDKLRSEMNEDPKMRNIWKWWTRFMVEDLSSNIRNPAAGWTGAAFASDRVAIVQLGYWFGAQLMTENPGYNEKYAWAPTPILRTGAKRYTNTLGATGTVIYAKTKYPDRAFRVFDWYTGGDYAVERARTGWGIPPLYSLRQYLPMGNEFNKTRADIAFDDAKYFVPWMASSLIKEFTPWAAAWNEGIDDLVQGNINADTFVDRYYAYLNKELEAGKKELGL